MQRNGYEKLSVLRIYAAVAVALQTDVVCLAVPRSITSWFDRAGSPLDDAHSRIVHTATIQYACLPACLPPAMRKTMTEGG